MPVFRITAPGAKLALLVRARCLSCSRDVAVRNAGAEGTRIWRDPALSSVVLLRDASQHGFNSDGPAELLKREIQDE